MFLVLLLAGMLASLPITIPLLFFVSAAIDFLVGGGTSATTTGSNEDGKIGIQTIRATHCSES